VQHELVGLFVEGGGGLEPCDVGAVANLRLRIAAQNVHIQGSWQPRRELLLGAEGAQRVEEHTEVEAKEDLALVGGAGPLELGDELGARVEVAVLVEVEVVELSHPVLEGLLLAPLVELVRVGEHWVLLHFSDSTLA